MVSTILHQKYDTNECLFGHGDAKQKVAIYKHRNLPTRLVGGRTDKVGLQRESQLQ